MSTTNSIQVAEKTHVLEPLPGRIVVRVDNFRYHGRLVIPDNAKRMPTTGIIESVGDDVKNVQPGQRIVFPMYSGTLIKFAGVAAYRILDEREVLCVVAKDQELELEDIGT
jgi:co-chaperonin GroES (HSP10)